MQASVPQGSVFGLILWNVNFNDLLQTIPAASAYANDCTISRTYKRKEVQDVIESVGRQLAHNGMGKEVVSQVCL